MAAVYLFKWGGEYSHKAEFFTGLLPLSSVAIYAAVILQYMQLYMILLGFLLQQKANLFRERAIQPSWAENYVITVDKNPDFTKIAFDAKCPCPDI